MNKTTAIQDLLKQDKLDAMFISSVPNIFYVTGFSGFSTIEREAFVVITKKKGYIFTDGRYKEAVEKEVKHYTLVEITSSRSLHTILHTISENDKLKTIGFESLNLTVSEHMLLKKALDSSKFKPTYGLIERLRVKKNAAEISTIRKACELGDKTVAYILPKVKEGMTERQLAFGMELFIKHNGAELAFPTIVAFGKHSSIPHHQTSDMKLKSSDFVLLDFGVKINNYCSDMTRTFVFGKASKKQKRLHQTVIKAQELAAHTLTALIKNRKVITASAIDKIARDYILSLGYPTIPHSLGHGIGIEVHEAPRLSPRSKEELTENMIFSIEPGIYLPNFGGVRIEDLVLIEQNGIRLLTKSQRELIEL